MAAISEIRLNGFKAFPNDFTLKLDNGKNLLMYGENGSGKSSIYYALHCLLQSQCNDKGSIYFNTDPKVTESIVNKDTNKSDASVEIKFEGSDVIYKISKSGYEESVTQPISPLKDLNGECVFINHKFLFHIFSFRNSQYINLFPVFIKDILPFTLAEDKSQFISQIYDDVMKGIVRIGRGRQIDPEFDKKILLFNTETKRVIDLVNTNSTKTATFLYNNFFRNEEDHELEISLMYNDNNDNVPIPNKSYWLRRGYIYKKEIVANVTQEVQTSNRVEILQPIITMRINEILSNGTRREIEKPQTFFNEAKLTAIALSIRFSLLDFVTDPNGRFMALDDMLISLDMGNRMKVIDFLLSEIGNKYKIYLFTHDALFYSSLKKRISVDHNNSNWLFGGLYMHNYNIKDNKLEACLASPMFITDEDSHLKAMEYYVKHDYPACGQKLRKWCEEILNDIFPDTLKKKLDPKSGRTVENTLNDKINQLEEYCSKNKIDFSVYKDLKIFKDNLLNTVSHYDISSPIYGEEILKVMKILSNLEDIRKSINEITVNHELEIHLTKPNGDDIVLCADIKNNKINIFNDGSNTRISYYKECTIKKIIINRNVETIENPQNYNSLYDAYNDYCDKNAINACSSNLLDITFSNNNKLRDLVSIR